jgi:hypothetical protein
MWVDLGEGIAFVLSREVVDVILLVVCFDFIQTRQYFARVDSTRVT